MKIALKTLNKLQGIAISFGNNFTITIDFLFYVFDTYSITEKSNMLRHCDIVNKESVDDNKETEKKESTIIDLELNKLLQDRIFNLVQECDELTSPTDVLEFLFFVLNNVKKDILEDYILQYTIESQTYIVEEPYVKEKSLMEETNPIHVEPDISDDSEKMICF